MTKQEQYEAAHAWDDLVVAGRPKAVDEFLFAVDARLPPEWSRNVKLEREANSRGFSLPESRCYATTVGGVETILWLLRVTSRRVKGGLVRSSDHARYLPNVAAAIVDFRGRILEPAAAEFQLPVGHDQLGPHSLVPSGVKDSLWSLYESCDFQWPPVGESLRRWRQFVATVYRESAAFDPDELRSWLVDKGWSPEHAGAMFERLVAGAALLVELDDLRQPA